MRYSDETSVTLWPTDTIVYPAWYYLKVWLNDPTLPSDVLMLTFSFHTSIFYENEIREVHGIESSQSYDEDNVILSQFRCILTEEFDSTSGHKRSCFETDKF